MTTNPSKIKPFARRRSRQLLLQALYSWMLTQNNIAEVEEHFLLEYNFKRADIDYFKELLHAIPQCISELDQQFEPFLDRSINELNPIELAVLRLGTYELLKRLEVPYRVVINEAVELTKTYGAEDGFKYVNSILDKVAKVVRVAEMAS